MQIVTKSIHMIDYENSTTNPIAPPPAFEKYVLSLIAYINGNTAVRDYCTVSRDTAVVACIMDSYHCRTQKELTDSHADAIAQKLLAAETAAQKRVERMSVKIQKGSLVQALLFDQASDRYHYLLAKVEHSDFVDDADFSFRRGFLKDNKNIWKTCLLELSESASEPLSAKIYSDTEAKYWCHDFLELIPRTNDQTNTRAAFVAVDKTLSQMIGTAAPYDHTILRNAFVAYFKNHAHLVFETMVTDTLKNYKASELSNAQLEALTQKLLLLPQERGFDHQFSPDASVIKNNIKQVYQVYPGISVQITDQIDDIDTIISTLRNPDGSQYIVIKTTDKAVFNRFHNAQNAK